MLECGKWSSGLALGINLRAQDVYDLEWRGDALMFWVSEHLFAFFSSRSPDTVVGLDACIGSSLCITQFVTEGKNIGRIFFELLQGILEE